MNRYAKIEEKLKREIVLLKGRPCFWGKCTFCDYIEDNTVDIDDAVRENREILQNVTGEFGVLECINSGNVFELPEQTKIDIRNLIHEKNIHTLVFEAHYIFKNRLHEIREFFGCEVLFKTGIESFDYDFRENVLNKNAKFTDVKEVSDYFDSACLMVGIKGQTKEMIERDIEIGLSNFKWITINIFINNSTPIKRDDELVKWFLENHYDLKDHPKVEMLVENTDLGVG
ncbi:radical SAM protein [Finegoldia magna]|uniref:radical SAM protein n=1 Tax=Finegoldia magna TaxID=1260 RepID=UPI0023A92A1C|nr:radical SAM protein [Finegoldia magna]MCC2718054.1 radical SAM protein [Finegoldia magna]